MQPTVPTQISTYGNNHRSIDSVLKKQSIDCSAHDFSCNLSMIRSLPIARRDDSSPRELDSSFPKFLKRRHRLCAFPKSDGLWSWLDLTDRECSLRRRRIVQFVRVWSSYSSESSSRARCFRFISWPFLLFRQFVFIYFLICPLERSYLVMQKGIKENIEMRSRISKPSFVEPLWFLTRY